MVILVVEDEEKKERIRVYKKEGVVEFVINMCERLGSNQAEIRPQVVPPAFSGGANSATLLLRLFRYIRP